MTSVWEQWRHRRRIYKEYVTPDREGEVERGSTQPACARGTSAQGYGRYRDELGRDTQVLSGGAATGGSRIQGYPSPHDTVLNVARGRAYIMRRGKGSDITLRLYVRTP